MAQPAPYYAGPAAPSTTMSLLSMIFGIAGLLLMCFYLLGFFFSVTAIILGNRGRSREQAKGMALAGLITGYAGVALVAVVVVIAILSVWAFSVP